MHIAQYTKAQTLAEAWELHQKKGSVVLGGCCWLRLSPQRIIRQAVDISALPLYDIEEGEKEFRIGAMVSLRDLELCPSFAAYTQGASKEALRHIVGVQFRNLATAGGSVCGRFGFSDVLTLLLALDASVVLYKGGEIKLADFAETGLGSDILTHIVVPKADRCTAYASLRLNATDFPVLACAVSCTADEVRCAVGARPARAQVLCTSREEVERAGADETARQWADALTYQSNTRGSAEYRRDMAEVLCRRLLKQVLEESK